MNTNRMTVADILADIGRIRGYFVQWRSAHWLDQTYVSQTFLDRVQAESFAHWVRARVGELAATEVKVVVAR